MYQKLFLYNFRIFRTWKRNDSLQIALPCEKLFIENFRLCRARVLHPVAPPHLYIPTHIWRPFGSSNILHNRNAHPFRARSRVPQDPSIKLAPIVILLIRYKFHTHARSRTRTLARLSSSKCKWLQNLPRPLFTLPERKPFPGLSCVDFSMRFLSFKIPFYCRLYQQAAKARETCGKAVEKRVKTLCYYPERR